MPQITSIEGAASWDCTLVDISAGGVRLMLDQADLIPQEFKLSLTKSRRLWRNCKIVWRTHTEIGARFADHSAV